MTTQTNKVLAKINEWSENLALLEGHSRLEYLIDLARHSTTMDESKRIEERLVTGCISKIWVDVIVELLTAQRRNGLGNLIATIISRFNQLTKETQQ